MICYHVGPRNRKKTRQIAENATVNMELLFLVVPISLRGLWGIKRWFDGEISGQQCFLDFQRYALPFTGAYCGKETGQYVGLALGAHMALEYSMSAFLGMAGGVAGMGLGYWMGTRASRQIDHWFAGSPERGVEKAYDELKAPMDASNAELKDLYKGMEQLLLNRKNVTKLNDLHAAISIILIHRCLPAEKYRNEDQLSQVLTMAYQELNVESDVSRSDLVSMYRELRTPLLKGKKEDVDRLDSAMAIIARERGLADKDWKSKEIGANAKDKSAETDRAETNGTGSNATKATTDGSA